MAKIVWLPGVSKKQNRLTAQDRREAVCWSQGVAGLWCRLVIYADPTEDEDIGDFVSIYRLGQSWASWGVARRGDQILLWQSDHGVDIGAFPTMADALQAILPSLSDLISAPQPAFGTHDC